MIVQAITFRCDICKRQTHNQFVQRFPIDSHQHKYLQTLPKDWTYVGDKLVCNDHDIIASPTSDTEEAPATIKTKVNYEEVGFISYKEYCVSNPAKDAT